MNMQAKNTWLSPLKHAVPCMIIINKIFLCCCLLILVTVNTISAQTIQSFADVKTIWRGGYERYDFLMDTTTLAIKPVKAPQVNNTA